MFIGFEQSIINKDFVHNKNSNNLLSFHKKTDILSQINLVLIMVSTPFHFQ